MLKHGRIRDLPHLVALHIVANGFDIVVTHGGGGALPNGISSIKYYKENEASSQNLIMLEIECSFFPASVHT